jgi:hypothetical protein
VLLGRFSNLPYVEEFYFMTVLMLMLLAAIAMIITLTGLFLSTRNTAQAQVQPRSRFSRRSSYRVPYEGVRGERRLGATKRAHRYVIYAEPRYWSWESIGRLLDLIKLRKHHRTDPTPWLGIALILTVVFFMGVYLLNALAPNVTLAAMQFANSVTSSTLQKTQLQAPQSEYHASQALVRLSQLDPGQYNSTQEYNLWAYSACSTAAMTEVFNAYGRHYRITDVLKVESNIGAITPQAGLLEDSGVSRTAAQFGFKTSWGYNLSLNQIIAIANQGRPVIVDWPPSKYAGGHLVVVTGGNSNEVYLADSSIYDRHMLSHAQFMSWWGGFYAIITPK